MNAREKKLVVIGLAFGLVLAVVALGVYRVFQPGEKASAHDMQSAQLPMSQQQESDPASRNTEMEPPASVELTDEEQRSIGLQVAEVKPRLVKRELATVAKVDEPETQVANISARIAGRIDKLYADFTGQPVRRGQLIAQIYSPDVLSTAEEYKLALENRKRLSAAESDARTSADELVSASRRRLELWGIGAKQIDEIATTPMSKTRIDVPIYATAGGVVMERKVTTGQYVNTGDVLYTVADLSSVWVKADVYEADLPQIRSGQQVEITADSLPGKTLHGKVNFIDPSVKADTRTISVRIQVPNPGLRLRPGMYVQANFATGGSQPTLTIPRSAVIDTGTRKIVYVAKGNGVFEGREVKLAEPDDNFYPVISGLTGGERVVAQGAFMVDSQTRITGGMSGMYGGSKEFGNHDQTPGGGAPAQSGNAKQNISLMLHTVPMPVKGAEENVFHIMATGPDGKPVSDAQCKLTLIMPAMPSMGMGEMRQSADLKWNGKMYEAKINVPMSGSWTVNVELTRGRQTIATYRTRITAK